MSGLTMLTINGAWHIDDLPDKLVCEMGIDHGEYTG